MLACIISVIFSIFTMPWDYWFTYIFSSRVPQIDGGFGRKNMSSTFSYVRKQNKIVELKHDLFFTFDFLEALSRLIEDRFAPLSGNCNVRNTIRSKKFQWTGWNVQKTTWHDLWLQTCLGFWKFIVIDFPLDHTIIPTFIMIFKCRRSI